MEEASPRADTTLTAPGTSTQLWHIAVSGSTATAAYVLLSVLPGPDWLAALVAFAFSASLSVGSVAIWRLLTALGTEEPLAMLSAGSNIIAGALFVSMVLVQLAIKDAQNPPDESARAVYWGLDVAWDLYLAAGTLGFAIAFLGRRWFRGWAVAGIAIALALVALNLASFPEPPGSAGLVDVGPLVGLWYFTLAVRAMFLLWSTKGLNQTSTPAVDMADSHSS